VNPGNGRVWLFGTCLVDLFYAEAGMDAVALLEACGFEVVFPPGQTCCGQPAWNSGYPEQCRPVARHCIELYASEPWPLIVPSASCAGMIQDYPTLFEAGTTLHAQARALAARTHELVSFLRPHLARLTPRALPEMSVALHCSCSAQRTTGSADDWLKALAAIPGLNLGIPDHAEECCGFGGTFSVQSPEVSLAMTEDKCHHLLATGAQKICSGDCGCLISLAGYLEHQGQVIESTHIASLLARAYLPEPD
jgi:L-lactate dehydrogenase complex protein LldE